MEAKRPQKSKTAKLQIETVKQIRAAGGEAYIVKTAEELKTIMAKPKGATHDPTSEYLTNDNPKA